MAATGLTKLEPIREALLRRLSSEPGVYVSGEALTSSLGLSHTAIWKAAEGLREAGYPLEAGLQGYRLEEDAPVSAGEGVPYTYLGSVGSTQDVAREKARDGAPKWTTVLTESQTAGRGRRGRTWHGPPGAGLYFTVVLRPPLPLAELGPLPLLAGAALHTAVKRETGLETLLKWPNDLLAPDGRKLAGVLLEAEVEDAAPRFVLLGIGLNVRRQDFPPDLGAAALEEFGGRVHRARLLGAIVGELRGLYGAWLERGTAEVLGRWRKASATLGRQVRVTAPGGSSFAGVARDVEDSGALLVETSSGTRRISAGEVSLRHLEGVP